MTTHIALLDKLAAWYVSTLPSATYPTQRVLQTIHRQLLTVGPVALDDLINNETSKGVAVAHDLEGWVLFGSDGRIDSGYEMTLRPTGHRLSIDDNSAFAFCPWDAIFLPLLLGEVVTLTTACPVSGHHISMAVSPSGIRSLAPRDSVMSFVMPSGMSTVGQTGTALEPRRRKEESIRQLCRAIHLFARPNYAKEWGSDQSEFFVLSIEEAVALAARVHRQVFAQLMTPKGPEMCRTRQKMA